MQDRISFRTAQAWLHRFGIPPQALEELSAIEEIPDDPTLVTWLLMPFVCSDDYRIAWAQTLIRACDLLSDFLGGDRPVVEICDDHRASFHEGLQRNTVSLNRSTFSDSWRTLCPVHLVYNCPWHGAFFCYLLATD